MLLLIPHTHTNQKANEKTQCSLVSFLIPLKEKHQPKKLAKVQHFITRTVAADPLPCQNSFKRSFVSCPTQTPPTSTRDTQRRRTVYVITNINKLIFIYHIFKSVFVLVIKNKNYFIQ